LARFLVDIAGGDAFDQASFPVLIPTDRLEELIKFFVFDVFRHKDTEGKLLDLGMKMISLVKLRFFGDRKESSFSSILRPNSVTGIFAKYFLDRFGRHFLEDLIKPTIVYVLSNDYLDLEISSGASSPRGSSEFEDFPITVNQDLGSPHRTLLSICDRLLNSIVSSAPFLPKEIRFFSKFLCSQVDQDSLRFLNDFLFLHWIVNCFWNPGWLADNLPISLPGRANLEAIGTVLLKLISGSRFSEFDDGLNTVNTFLESWMPKVSQFSSCVIDVPLSDSREILDIPEQDLRPLAARFQSLSILASSLRIWLESEKKEDDLNVLRESNQRLMSLPTTISSVFDEYIVLDVGVPQFFSSSSIFSKDAEDGELANQLIAILKFADFKSLEKSSCSRLLLAEAELEMRRQSSSISAMIVEAASILSSRSSASEFLDFCNRRVLSTVEQYKESCSQAIQIYILEQKSARFLENIKRLESLCASRLKAGRTREILDSLSARIRYFRGQLHIRYGKMKKYSCTGLCILDNDVFVCKRCALLLQKQLEALEVAVQDCVRVLESSRPTSPVLQSKALKVLNHSDSSKYSTLLSKEQLSREIMDYLVACSYDSVMILCVREEARLLQKLNWFSSMFSSYKEFLTYVDNDGTADLDNRSYHLKVLNVSESCIAVSITCLRNLDSARSLSAKMNCFIKAREALIGLLGSLSGRGVDDYMPLLCYVIVRAKVNNLLSSLNFLRVLYPDVSSVKVFVDICVAVKFLLRLRVRFPSAVEDTLNPLVQTWRDSKLPEEMVKFLLNHGLWNFFSDLGEISAISPEVHQKITRHVICFQNLCKKRYEMFLNWDITMASDGELDRATKLLTAIS
jgi:hypothetical protein